MKEIITTNGHKALVDDEDYDFLSSMNWYADPQREKINDN
jgi:hypothetical protein